MASSGSGSATPGGNAPGETAPGAPLRGRDEVLASLAAMPDELGRMLSNRPVEDVMQPSRDGGWGVIEILCHLRDWDEIYLDRLHATVEQERPFLPSFDDELWPIERDYRGQDPARTFERLRALRGDLVAYLTALPVDAWQRQAVHALHGEVTLHWLANHICDHDREHLAQVQDALA